MAAAKKKRKPNAAFMEQPRQRRFLKPKAGNGGFLRESAFPAES